MSWKVLMFWVWGEVNISSERDIAQWESSWNLWWIWWVILDGKDHKDLMFTPFLDNLMSTLLQNLCLFQDQCESTKRLITTNLQEKITKINVITDFVTRKRTTVLLVIIHEQFMWGEGWFYCLKVIGFPSWSWSVALLVWHLSGKYRVPPPDIKEESGQFNNTAPALWQQCQWKGSSLSTSHNYIFIFWALETKWYNQPQNYLKIKKIKYSLSFQSKRDSACLFATTKWQRYFLRNFISDIDIKMRTMFYQLKIKKWKGRNMSRNKPGSTK